MIDRIFLNSFKERSLFSGFESNFKQWKYQPTFLDNDWKR